MNKKRGFLLAALIVIILVIVIGTLGMIFSPYLSNIILKSSNTSSVTQTQSNIVHFSDDQKLISFDYPLGATNVKSISPSPVGGMFFSANYREWITDPTSWTISISGVPILNNIEKTKKDIFDKTKLQDSKFVHYSEIMETSLGGERAMSYKQEASIPPETKIISMLTTAIHNNMLYTVGIGISDKTNQEAVKQATDAYNLIRTSFKFLK